MKRSREIIAVVILIGLFIVFSISFSGHGTNESRQILDDNPQPGNYDTSPFSTRSTGSLGVFSLVQRLGYKSVVWRRGWSELGKSGGDILLIINPDDPSNMPTMSGIPAVPSDTDLKASDWPLLCSWLKTGHTAVLLESAMSANSGQASGNATSFEDASGISVNSAPMPVNEKATTEFPPAIPGPYTVGVISVYSGAESRVKQINPDGALLFGDSSGPVVLCKKVGKGQLFVVADSLFLSNAELPHSENAVFFANLLAQDASKGGRVLFDEYHQGDAVEAGDQGVWSVLGRPLKLAFLQALLALVALFAVFAVRFGRPAPAMQGVTRSSGEYVTSLAGLYRRAGATTAALETIYRHFLRDLCARLGVPGDTRLDVLARVAARRAKIDETALRTLLVHCEQRLDEGYLQESELVELVKRIERMRKDVGIV